MIEGHTFIPVELVGPVVDIFINPPPEDEWKQLVGALSDRERQVLELMVTGLDRREIAEALTISLNTVRTHVKNILARVGVHSSLEAVSLALRAGMRPVPHPLAGGGQAAELSPGRARRS
ncbi:MAG TPA: LuxR C-terminal-related transcriptional regulator [Aquihabitans sp.]|nr:LuxR C-terminal-related transcriptional regulator [Aquihabitans sp.]